MGDQSVIRITKELAEIQKNSDLSLAVACRDIDVRSVKALIIGPHETPYEFGFFEFALKFNREYPRKPPTVNAVTTNQGRCRFNPNIYASGKVCLSILGTWRGERGEEWSAAQGLESILLSIQSLMSANPYENEPGFEDANEASDKANQRDYIQKIRHETIRISVIQRLEEYLGIDPGTEYGGSLAANDNVSGSDSGDEDLDEANIPFEPFKDLCKRRFLWYYDSYIAAVQKGASEVKDGQSFTRMPFEGSSNQMEGKFHYPELEQRLRVIKQVLDAETAGWAKEGLRTKIADSTIGFNLKSQFHQVAEAFKANGMPHNVELVDNNPYLWAVTYVGKPMTNLDGGLFHFNIHISPRFPDEQPRVVFKTKLFHHRISPDGTVCYFANPLRREDLRSHIENVFDALEEENPPYDPRTIVNPDASKLYWGSPDDRRMYNRQLRRSVQKSMEDF